MASRPHIFSHDYVPSNAYCARTTSQAGAHACVPRLADADEQHSSCAGRWVQANCTAAAPLAVCGGVCQMQTSQSGGVDSGHRRTTTCVETATADCDCGLFSCSTEHSCTCTTCVVEWVCD